MRRAFLAAVGLLACGAAYGQYFRGVNVSEAEWGDPITGQYPTDFAYPTAPTFQYFAARSLGFIRLQIQWERLQPVLGGPLDPTSLGYLKQDIAWAKAAGAQVSIVPHNQARYTIVANGIENLCIIDNPCVAGTINVTAQDLADFWVRMSNEFVAEPTVVAYDLMNEPHDMGLANWNQISQTVVSAIRANGDNKLVMVPGDGWSSAEGWLLYNGLKGWIGDPANHIYYEAHQYFDSDGSGAYAMTYEQEMAADGNLAMAGVNRIKYYLEWCTYNNVKCYLGEYGIPNDDPGWLTVLDNFLHALDGQGIPGTIWAAGELWSRVNYPLSVQPSGGFAMDREQLPTMLAHLPPNAFRTASAAASYGWAMAPGQLAAGYGTGLAPAIESATMPLPTTLQNTQVQLTDSQGNVSFAPLLYVSPAQINYQIPAGTNQGLVTATVLSGGNAVASGVLEMQPIAPTIFTANFTGEGLPAAQIMRVHSDGSQAPIESVATYDQSTSEFVAAPISFDDDSLYLILYGTGFDQVPGAQGVSVTIGSQTAPVTFAGPQSQYAGLDQINVQLPASLAGAGMVEVAVTVNGIAANPVMITFQ